MSFFEEKLVIHFSSCEKTIVFRFWTKVHSCFSYQSNKIWNQAKSILPRSNSLQNFKQIEQNTAEILHFQFFYYLAGLRL